MTKAGDGKWPRGALAHAWRAEGGIDNRDVQGLPFESARSL